MSDDALKNSLNLPKTDLPMRGNLPNREPEIIEFWNEIGLWKQLREQSLEREKFILHDGPPYANGNIHIGTALNKILKDIINRSRQMTGYNAHYVPGWDCHGLPIEWKIEEKYREKGLDKNQVPILDFRKECREFADHWLNVQRGEFKRLGVMGDWENPYSTMNFESEAIIAAEILKFLMSGALYKGQRPVMWSVVEQTALAEAELEYYEHKSPTITVAFKIRSHPDAKMEQRLQDASIIIWTTTPWTIPGNRALAYAPDMDYVLITIDEVEQEALIPAGMKLLLAKNRLSFLLEEAKITAHRELDQFKGHELDGIIANHPWHDQGYDDPRPLLSADFVTDEQGTGFVHIAPGHGTDDWLLGRKNGLEAVQTVKPDGKYAKHVPLMDEAVVIDNDGKYGNANGKVIGLLKEAGALVAKASLRHQYPHSWRSRAPLIFLNTAQWFISMTHDDLRDKALKAIDDTDFYPPQGRNRLRGMIANRPDWCISRQRAWGVPIPIFVHKETGEALKDEKVNQRILNEFKIQGGDAWFACDPQLFLGGDYNADDYEQVKDVVDVWFDSGVTHAFCLEQRPELKWPADLYLEGSDQHRGWFHSSLLNSSGTRGRAPYDAVLTHGFVQDQIGRKMSKALGNQVFPEEVNSQYGADILRLWVVSENYFGDLRIGPNNLKQMADYYRRFRNSLRWLLGNLAHQSPDDVVDPKDMPLLEQWMLAKIHELDKSVRHSIQQYDFNQLFRDLLQFCTNDLSATYFDIRKDTLYCDRQDSLRRRSCLTILAHLFDALSAWLAPFLCFTTEEAWQQRRLQLISKGVDLAQDYDGRYNHESVHLRQLPTIPSEWENLDIIKKWESAADVRRAIYGLLETQRANKVIGSSLEAAPVLFLDFNMRPDLSWLKDDHDFIKEISIISDLSFADEKSDEFWHNDEYKGIFVGFAKADGQKCPRCWMIHHHQSSKQHHDFDDLCERCDDYFA